MHEGVISKIVSLRNRTVRSLVFGNITGPKVPIPFRLLRVVVGNANVW